MDSDGLIGILALIVGAATAISGAYVLLRGARQYGPHIFIDRHTVLSGGFGRFRHATGATRSLWLLGSVALAVFAGIIAFAPRKSVTLVVTGKYYQPAGYHTTATYGIDTTHGTWFASNRSTYDMMEKGLSYRCRVVAALGDKDLQSCSLIDNAVATKQAEAVKTTTLLGERCRLIVGDGQGVTDTCTKVAQRP